MSGYPSGLTYRPIVTWPGPLTLRRRSSPFSSTLSATLALLTKEIRELPARNVVLQLAITEGMLRRDGLPRADARPEHPGVILSLESPSGALSYPCDTFTRWEDNLRAIAKTMENLRAIDRYGVTRNGEQYRGWLALESSAVALGPLFSAVPDAAGFIRAMSGLRPNDDDRAGLAAAVRRAKFHTHPDQGGDASTFQKVTEAEMYLREHGAL